MSNEVPTANGVVISSKELFQQMQEVAASLHRIESRIEAMERRLYEEIDESKKAHDLARDAHKIAENALNKANDAITQIEEMKKNQRGLRNALLITIAGVVATFALEKMLGG